MRYNFPVNKRKVMTLIKMIPKKRVAAKGMFAKAQFALNKNRCNVNIIISNELAEIISKPIADKVDVFYDEKNPFIIVIRKSENDNDGYKLRKSRNNYSLSFSWRFRVPEKAEERKTRSYFFDMHPEGGLQICLSSEFCPYPGG